MLETLATAISIFDGEARLTFFNSAFAEVVFVLRLATGFGITQERRRRRPDAGDRAQQQGAQQPVIHRTQTDLAKPGYQSQGHGMGIFLREIQKVC